MADLKIPNMNKNSDKFFFKKKLSLGKKSKRKLKKESFLMLFSSFFLNYLVYLIPNKELIFKNFSNNFSMLIGNVMESLTYFYQICLVLFIVLLLLSSFVLILGSFTRFMKILKRKNRPITFR